MNIEIPDEDIQEKVAKAVKAAVIESAGSWQIDEHIRTVVRGRIKSVADALIDEALADVPKLKEKIAAEIEAKLRRQIAAATKAA